MWDQAKWRKCPSGSSIFVTAASIDAYNTFEKKDVVKKPALNEFILNKDNLKISVPTNSVMMVSVKKSK